MRKSYLTSIVAGISLTFLAATLSMPAQAQNVVMPPNWEVFPHCQDTQDVVMCVQAFEVDDNSDGIFEDALTDEDLSVNAYLFDNKANNVASLAAYFYSNGYQDLSPRLPVGSQINLEINTRDWKPNPQAFTAAKLDAFRVEQVDGEWITYATITTKSFSVKRAADQGGGVMTQASQAGVILWGNEYRDAYDVIFDGMWTSSNASITNSPWYDSEAMTWTIETSGTPVDSEGDSNVAYFNAFFPDSAIISAYGADPVAMAGIFKVLRKDGTETVEQEVVITRVEEPTAGILIEIPAYGFSSNEVFAPLSGVGKVFAPFAGKKYRSPKHVIKPKTKLISAPALRSVTKSGSKAVLTGTKGGAAKAYQGVCIKGSKVKYGTANKPRVTVDNLTKGNWNCRIRGVKKIGGKWSNQIKVKIS